MLSKSSGLKIVVGFILVASAFGLGWVYGVKRLYPTNEFLATVDGIESRIQEEQLAPREFARWQYERRFGPLRWIETTHPDAAKTDPASIIHVRTPEQVVSVREKLYRYIWKKPQLAKDRLPDTVERGIEDERYSSLAALNRIDRYTVSMEFGIDSIVYHFHPVEPNGRVVIYHQGHRGDFFLGIRMISALLDQGYEVLGFAMPFKGLNPAPDIDSPQFGYIKNFGHNTFHLLESESLAPIKFFLEPLLAVVNLVVRERPLDCLGMVGISGGGWTTILYAALDDRICFSYPVAGKLPIYLLALPPNDRNTNNRADLVVGDYEEFVPALSQIANFLDLSVLGAAGPGRHQVQVINKYDRVTYRGVAALHYQDAVRSTVGSLSGGRFQVMIDDTHTEHQISPYAQELILRELAVSEAGNDSRVKAPAD